MVKMFNFLLTFSIIVTACIHVVHLTPLESNSRLIPQSTEDQYAEHQHIGADSTGRDVPECELNVNKNGMLIADCRSKGLRHIPQTLPTNVNELLLDDNDIDTVMPSALGRFSQLKHLFIANNNVAAFDIAQTAPQLVVLEMGSNPTECTLRHRADVASFATTAADVTCVCQNGYTGNGSFCVARPSVSDVCTVQPVAGAVSNTAVNCSGQALRVMPTGFPPSTVELALDGNALVHLGRQDFTERDALPRLQTLTVRSNSIVTIEQAVFATLPALQTLEMDGNPSQCVVQPGKEAIRCTCADGFSHVPLHLRLRSSEQDSVDDIATCARRDTYVDICAFRRLHVGANTSPDLFQTAAEQLVQTVTPSTNATSSLVRLDCQSRGLRRLPYGLIGDVSELSASYNNIGRISVSDLVHLSSLATLLLSHNRISYIEAGSFTGMTVLVRLDLSNNALCTLSSDVFQLDAMGALQMFDITGNPSRCAVTRETAPMRSNRGASMLSTGSTVGDVAAVGAGGDAPPVAVLGRWQWSTCVCAGAHEAVGDAACVARPLAQAVCSQRQVSVQDSVTAATPTHADTPTEGIALDCTKQELEFFPTGVPEGVVHLALDRNRIALLRPQYFTRMTQLEVLSLADNPITHIPTDVFTALQALQVLDLHGDNMGMFGSIYGHPEFVLTEFPASTQVFLPAHVPDSSHADSVQHPCSRRLSRIAARIMLHELVHQPGTLYGGTYPYRSNLIASLSSPGEMNREE
eukprot:m.821441 g.821441  ORF g.821441 m.821441 type:complete len:749 (-) comp23400_c0_seq1:1009-3255(-)